MSQIVQINDASHFSRVLSSSRIVVTNFYAESDGASRAIAPIYDQLSQQLAQPGIIVFAKVNIEAQTQIAQSYNITERPTFLIFKAGRETKRIKGSDPKGLNAAIKQLAQEAAKGGEDGSGAGAGSSGSGWTAFAAPRGYSDATDSVDTLGLDFLNLDSETGDKRTIFDPSKPSSLDAKGKSAQGSAKKDWIESDTDEQLMLFIPFQATIKLHSLHITSILPADESEDDEAPARPKTLRLYTNRSTVLGFDEAEGTPAVQKITLQPSDWDDKTRTAKVELRYVKFQNIHSLVVFVEEGEGEAEKTRIDRLRLFGETGEKKAMGKLEKIGDEQGE